MCGVGGSRSGAPARTGQEIAPLALQKVPDPTHPESRWETSFGGTSIFLSWDPLVWVLIRERRSGRLCLDLPRTPPEPDSCRLLLDSGPPDSSVLCAPHSYVQHSPEATNCDAGFSHTSWPQLQSRSAAPCIWARRRSGSPLRGPNGRGHPVWSAGFSGSGDAHGPLRSALSREDSQSCRLRTPGRGARLSPPDASCATRWWLLGSARRTRGS